MRESGGIKDAVDGKVGALPEVGKRGVGLFAQTGFLLLTAFDKVQHIADRYRFGTPGQHVSAFSAAARFDEAALFEAGENEFQKLLWNLLPASNLSDFHWLGASVCSQVEDGLESVFTLDRNVHWN